MAETQNPIPPPPLPVDRQETGAAQKIRRQGQIHNLAEVMDVVRLERQNALNRRLVRKTQDGTVGQAGDDMLEEDMNVNVGDQIYYGVPGPNQAPPDQTGESPSGTGGVNTHRPESTSRRSSSILPLVATALLGTGLGGLGTGLATYYLNREPTPVVQPTPPPPIVDRDTRNRYLLTLPQGKPGES